MSLDITLKCDHCDEEVFDGNITHNLVKMARECGLYLAMWHPEDLKAAKASDLIEPLRSGIAVLESSRVRFEEFNPPNGWGSYDGLLRVAKDYLEACVDYPDAIIEVDR